MTEPSALAEFLASGPLALVEVASAKGSTPRDAGAWMLVSRKEIYGTIGGGQLEYMAIDKARNLLKAPTFRKFGTMKLDIPLGPEIGQCCGGRVEVAIRMVDKTVAETLKRRDGVEQAQRPHVYIFGGGHVGHALAQTLSLLPMRTIVVETREQELRGISPGAETRLTAVPEDVVREAPAGSAYLILTHDHALDFLIVAEALKRVDAGYVGMIGSKTKKATFRGWFLKNAGGTAAEFAKLVSPIGGDTVKDKRPAIIAALAAAEVTTALASHQILVGSKTAAAG